MKTTFADVRYCGVRAEVVTSARPTLCAEVLQAFLHFIVERYTIHHKKDVLGLQRPYTNDPILRDYKFTNVRREHDRQTRYLIDNVSLNPTLSLEDKIINTFMFRAWNNFDTFCFFELPQPATRLYNPKMKERSRRYYYEFKLAQPEAFEARKWWSSAYNQGGTKAAWKFPAGDGYQRAYKESEASKFDDWERDIPLRPFHLGPWLARDRTIQRLLASKDQEEAFEVIKSVRGFSNFLAYQIFVDLTYINEPEAGQAFSFSENEFTVAGPGCKKGLSYLFKNNGGMSAEEQIFWLRDKMPKLMHKYGYNLSDVMLDLPEEDRYMNVMSIENCLCDLSKYMRALRGTGRPRVKYTPYKEA